MSLTRRQLLKRSLLLGSTAPFSLNTAWAGQGITNGPGNGRAISVFGSTRSVTELGLGFLEQGWVPAYQGRFDPQTLDSYPRGQWATGFIDEAGMVLLSSLLVGRGRVLALGRHEAATHHLHSLTDQPLGTAELYDKHWHTALGRQYARLAGAHTVSHRARNTHSLPRLAANSAQTELSFLVQL